MKNIYYLLLFGFMSVSLFAMQDTGDKFDIDNIDYIGAYKMTQGYPIKYEAKTKSGIPVSCSIIIPTIDDLGENVYRAQKFSCSIGGFKLNENDSSEVASRIEGSIRFRDYLKVYRRSCEPKPDLI